MDDKNRANYWPPQSRQLINTDIMRNDKSTRKEPYHQPQEVRRRSILDAAIACFSAAGYSGTTVEQISKKAGLSKGSVYRFFPSKEDILLAILKKFESDINTQLASTLKDVASYQDKIRLKLEVPLTAIHQYTDIRLLWAEISFHPITSTRYRESVDTKRAELATFYAEGVKAGDFIDQPYESVIDLLSTYQQGLFHLSMIDENFDIAAQFENTWPLISRTFFR